MPRNVSTSLLAFALSTTGCFIFDHDPKRDGSDCDHDDECVSGACRGGMCTASSCNVSDNCQGGFTCEMAPTWVEVLSLGVAKGVCLPDCTTCPWMENPRWICGGASCDYDANPHVDIGGPYEGIVGDPIALDAMIELDHGAELQAIEWHWNGMVISTERAAEIVPDAPGIFTVDVTVTDDAYGYGGASAQVTVCGEQGNACYYPGDCCMGLACRMTGTCE